MDAENVRSVVWEAVRKSNWRGQFAELHAGIKRIASEKGIQFEKDEIEVLANQWIWYLLTRGVIAPTGDDKHFDFRFLQITEHGNQYLNDETKPENIDPGQYIEQLEAPIRRSIDDVIKVYVRESLKTFLSGNYFAATVMLSIASEQCVEILIEEITGAGKKKGGKGDFETKVRRTGLNTRDRFEILRSELVKAALPGGLAETVELQLSGLLALIRYSRDGEGNPKGRECDRDTVHAGLLLFPRYCKWVYEVIGQIPAESEAKISQQDAP